MTWSVGVDRASGPDWSVLQYPRVPRWNWRARKLVAGALREWRRQRRAADRVRRYGRSRIVVRS